MTPLFSHYISFELVPSVPMPLSKLNTETSETDKKLNFFDVFFTCPGIFYIISMLETN